MKRDWHKLLEEDILNRVIRTSSAAGDIEAVYDVPNDVLETLYQQLTDGDASAGYALAEVGAAAIELGDWGKAVWMKRAGEGSLRLNERSYHDFAVESFEPYVNAALKTNTSGVNFLDHDKFHNPVDVLTAISWEPTEEDEAEPLFNQPFLPGCYFGTVYRFRASRIVGARDRLKYILPASFELELYLRYGMELDGYDVLQWILSTAPLDITPQNDELRALVGNAFARCGHAFYRHTNDLKTAESLYAAAVGVGRGTGDELAPDLFYLADIALQNKEWRVGIERLEQLLATPGVTDEKLLQGSRWLLQMAKAELTGEPSQAFQVDESIRENDLLRSRKSFARISRVLEASNSLDRDTTKTKHEFHASSQGTFSIESVMRTLGDLTRKKQQGAFVDPFELDSAVGQFIEAHQWVCSRLESKHVDAEFLITSAKMIFNFAHRGFFIKRLNELKAAYARTEDRFSASDQHHLDVLIGELEAFKDRINATRPAESSNATQSVSYKEGGDSETKRIELLKSQLVIGLPWLFPEGVDEKPPFDFTAKMPHVIEDLKAIFDKRVTPDGVKPMAAHLLQLTEFVAGHFLRIQGLNTHSMRYHIDRDYRPSLQFGAEIQADGSVCLLYRFLQHVTAWIGAGYREQMLSEALRQCDQNLSSEFRANCDQLAESLGHPRDFLFRVELKDGTNDAGGLIDKIRLTRNLCTSSLSWTSGAESESASSLDEIPPGCEMAFLVNTPVPQNEIRDQLISLFVFSNDGLKISLNSQVSRRWLNVYLANREYRGAIRETLRLHAGGVELSKFLSAATPTCLTDLTRMNTPLSAIEPNGPIVIDSRMPAGNRLPKNASIELWCPYLNDGSIHADETDRVVRVGKKCFEPYPSLPDQESDLFTEDGDVLAYSHFERWTLSDLASHGLCQLEIPAEPTRVAFISTYWRTSDVIHISAHGEAFAGVPDATNITLDSERTATASRLHYNDILGLDLTNVTLVVLSVCMSKYGVQWANDEDLSLAWAFRAAGAKSVIGSRWNVPDAAAWYFSHHFYDALLRRETPIRESFRIAINELQRHPLFATPDVWGTFALVD